MLRKLLLALTLIVLFPSLSCGKKGTPFIPSIGIVILPTVASVVIGQTQQFEATVLNSSSGVTWSVDGGDEFGSIDASGLYTAPSVVPTGALAIVRSKLADDNLIQETSEVNILTAP